MPPKKPAGKDDVKVEKEPIDTSWHEPGVKLWYETKAPDGSEYFEGIFQGYDEKTEMIKFMNKDSQAKEQDYVTIYQFADVQTGDNDDLVDLITLNDASLLMNIKDRTERDEIYMYCGPTLLAMNPFRMIPKLFGKDSGQAESFIKHSKDRANRDRIQPHIWSTACESFKALMNYDMRAKEDDEAMEN